MLRRASTRLCARLGGRAITCRFLSAAASSSLSDADPQKIRSIRGNPKTEGAEQADPSHPAATRKIQPHHFSDDKLKWFPHPVYTKEEVEAVEVVHDPPKSMSGRIAYGAVQFARGSFDLATNYGTNMTESKWLTRMIFLETVAGVPGMVGAMCRHFNSLRSMKRDQGWLHELLAEAENERAHLLTFLELKQPGIAFRAMVLLAQGVFFNAYFLAYLVSPSTCHRFVQYLEEEAVKTYTKAVQQVDDPNGGLDEWRQMPASPLSRKYWQLPEDAMFRDVLMAIRADEAIHRDVNGTLADLPADAPNPFA